MSHIYNLCLSKIRAVVLRKITRSDKWGAVEKATIQREPECAACGAREHLQVHHKEPFHLNPELELDPENLIVLCMAVNECHLRIGHGGNFKAYNPNVIKDCLEVQADIQKLQEVILRAKVNRLFS